MRRFGLLGHRISYSLSPVIHRKVFELVGVDATYELIDLSEEELVQRVDEIFRTYEGFNVTIPHKVRILPYLRSLSREAEIAGAVNTVKTSERVGFNTDVYGVIHAVKHAGLELSGLTALILGAGGAARAVVYALTQLGVARITVCNRSRERAEELRQHFAKYGIGVEVRSWDERAILARQVDVVVNCTPVGTLSWESPLPEDVFRPGQIVIDLVYRPRITKLLHDAQRCGARVVDGLSVLIFQALEADKIWLGINVVRDDVYEEVEREVSKYV